MMSYIEKNCTLLDDGDAGIYLIVRDEITNIVQEYAIMPEEVAAIQEVTNKWLMANPGYNV